MISPHDIINRLRRSEVPWERTAIYAGRVVSDGSPYLIPIKSFLEHGAMIGPPGMGKTATFRNCIWQLRRMPFRHSLFVINGKAFAPDLQHETLDEPSRPRRWLTTGIGRSTYVFNPFDQPWYRPLSGEQKTDYWLSALNLSYGTKYGESHFTDANAAILSEALAQNPGSLKELAEASMGVVRQSSKNGGLMQETKSAGVHVTNVVRRLAKVPMLNGESTFDLSGMFRDPSVLYGDFPLTIGSEMSRYAANLVLYSLPPAAMSVPPSERIPIVAFKDEATRFLGRNTALLMMQFRELGSIVLGFQGYEDVREQMPAMASAIENNISFEWIFGATTAKDIKRLIDISGETVEVERSAEYMRGGYRTFAVQRPGGLYTTQRSVYVPSGTTQGMREVVLKRLNVNEIAQMTANPNYSLVRERGGHHLALPVVIEHFFHRSKSELAKLLETPWPAPNPDTIVNRDAEPPAAPATVAPAFPLDPPQQDNRLRPKKQRPR